MRVAVLDDWQRVAEISADWTPLRARAEVVFFHEAFASEDEAAEKLLPFDVLLAMRERTAFPASLVRRLTGLKMFNMTGGAAATSDFVAMRAQGVVVTGTGRAGTGSATSELALALMLAAARNIPQADASVRRGRFQEGVAPGYELKGKVLGLIGLGRLGSAMAGFGRMLGMETVAWSPHLTMERAAEGGAVLVSKGELLARSDVVSIHMVLSERTRGLVGTADLARMKHGALLINTSRGPLVDEAAMVAALEAGRIHAALDVFDREPLQPGHRLLTAPNTVLTPHLGYVSVAALRDHYRASIENVLAFLDGTPIRVIPA